jgi:hypothetical protein
MMNNSESGSELDRNFTEIFGVSSKGEDEKLVSLMIGLQQIRTYSVEHNKIHFSDLKKVVYSAFEATKSYVASRNSLALNQKWIALNDKYAPEINEISPRSIRRDRLLAEADRYNKPHA